MRPKADGSAIILVEDERTATQLAQHEPLNTLMAIARVLNAQRVVELKYAGKGEVRYACNAKLPTYLFDAVRRAGASISDRAGETAEVPPAPGAVAPVVDQAFASLAHETRKFLDATDIAMALRRLEDRRRKAMLDKDTQPALYWPAVLELAALAGELSRARGGRWVDTKDLPVPYAVRFPDGALATPTKLAQQIVEGAAPTESLAP